MDFCWILFYFIFFILFVVKTKAYPICEVCWVSIRDEWMDHPIETRSWPFFSIGNSGGCADGWQSTVFTGGGDGIGGHDDGDSTTSGCFSFIVE